VKPIHDDFHVLTGSYVLDAVSEPERQEFERHLESCGPCDAEVRGLRETAAGLAMAKALRPPARMEERVLAATYRTRQLPPLPEAQPDRDRRSLRTLRLAGRRNGRDRRRTRAPQLLGALAAAAAAAAIALGATQAITQHQLDTARASSAAITKILAAPDARIETMRTSVGGTVTVIASAGQRDAVIATAGMRPLPPAQVYQLWVMGPAGARSAGLLLSRTGQAGPVLADEVRPGDRIGITVEPSGGTSRPTTTPVIVMPVPV
jgi:Anti-sigma-K factor rskA/Putative zinc-finger